MTDKPPKRLRIPEATTWLAIGLAAAVVMNLAHWLMIHFAQWTFKGPCA